MKQFWTDLTNAVCMGMLLPGLILNAATLYLDTKGMVPSPEPVKESAIVWPVMVRTGDAVTRMDLERYITGVVLAEMPASFEEEALKAQSVAARTYAAKACATGGKHGDGSVCTESACCQGYLSEERYLEKGGTRESAEKIAAAVADTAGLVLTYEDELIEATYFSCSGGRTEDAAAVWGTEFPYLQSVSSPGEENAQSYTQSCIFSPEEFQRLLGRSLSGAPEHWFSMITYTEGGGVSSMTIGGQVYSGTELRSLLGLRSTAFTAEASSEGIEIITKGYGHRVGLSQYGADAMAVAGSNYQEILAHYYPGTELAPLSQKHTEQ